MKRFWHAAQVLVLGFAGTAFAAPFQNGSFEVGAPGNPVTGVPVCLQFNIAGSIGPGWTVSTGNVDWACTFQGFSASAGSYSLDLVGTGGTGGVTQIFDISNGTSYQVLFDLAGNPAGIDGSPVVKPLAVTFTNGGPPVIRNYTFDTFGKSPINMGWATKTFTFVANGSSATIDFVSNLGGAFNAGAALDNVRVQQLNPWVGAAGSVTNAAPGTGQGIPYGPPYQGTPIPSSLTLTSNGTAGAAADFTYQTGPPNDFCCHTGDWTFETTVTTDGDYRRNVTYSGYHGTCGAVATLIPYFRRGAVTTYGTPLYDQADICPNSLLPAGGFAAGGPVVFQGLQAGDAYGFVMHASNYDANGAVGGRLTVTTGTDPTTTTLLSSANPLASASLAITFTATVTGSAPTGHVTFTQEGRELQGCRALPLVGGTAQCIMPSWFAGPPRAILAFYSGDSVNAGSVNLVPLSQAVGAPPTPSPTITTLGSVPNPSVLGGNVTFTATVSTTVLNNNLSGTVDFLFGANPLCLAVPLTGGGDTQQAVCVTSSLPPFNNPITATYSGNAFNLSSQGGTSQLVTPPVFAAPTLIRAVAVSGGTYLIGRSLPSATISVSTFSASSCNAGVAGGTSPLLPIFPTVSTDSQGYFAVSIPGVNSGTFISAQINGASPMSNCIPSSGDNDYWPKALDLGAAPPSIGDYIDVPGKARWYKFSITPGQKITVTLSGSAADYDVVVFKDLKTAFDKLVTPTDATALNKLNAEFAPSTFSPSTFSPSTFSPSTFSPDAYAPSTFSPSTFSSSLFAPSTFSPSTFSPSTFSPSTFSPSTFSPSTFSPSTFSPSTFSPSTFSPASVFGIDITTPTGLALVRQAFSSAQTSSIIGVSATPGTGNETVVVNSWNETGNFYVRVGGRGDGFSTSGQFALNVAKGATTCTSVTPLAPLLVPRADDPGPNVKTVILLDSTKVALNTLVGGVTLQSRLDAFKVRSEIGGVIVDVNSDARVNTLKTQANAHKDCPYATNLVAEEIKSLVDTYRKFNPNLRYVVIVGNDGAIPFFRYPDETLIGQESGYDPPVASATISDASLINDFVLSQDAYGAKTRISMRSILFPVPGLAVGRLIETPAEIAGLIDAYTAANGLVPGTKSLVTGYDFLADAASAVEQELKCGTGALADMSICGPNASSTGAVVDKLITQNGVAPEQSWNATQLSSALFDNRHDVIFLAGHFSANSALAADFSTSLLTSDLAASTTNFTNSIVFSAGCHAGYNIVDSDAIQGVTNKLDWPQAFAQKKATLIAGTGYQYGDTDFVEYSERLYKNFARQLRAGTAGTPIAVGEALNRAKTDYIAVTPDIRGIHLKAVLEATVFGLPMLSVNMPAARGAIAPDAGVITPTLVTAGTPGAQLGLRTADFDGPTKLTPLLTPGTTCLKTDFNATNPLNAVVPPCTSDPGYKLATWLNGPDGVVSNPAEPVLPLQVVNVTPTTSNIALRGVGFLGGTYVDTADLVPLTGAPATEIRGVHTSFSSPYFFPMRLTTSNYFAALAGVGGTRLLVTPAQHHADDLTLGTSVLRKYTGLSLRLYYSDNVTATALSAAPTIGGVNAVSSGGGVTFSARITGDPAAAIHEAWVTWTDGSGTWSYLKLNQCPHAACGATTDTQLWMGQLPSAPLNAKYIVQAVNGIGLVSLDDNLGAYHSFTGAAPQTAAPTTLTLNLPPTNITYGQTPTVNATLNSSSGPVGGATLSVSAGGTSAAAITAGTGVGSVQLAKVAPGSYQLKASYAGSGTYQPSTASSLLTVSPAQSLFIDDSVTVSPAAFLVSPIGPNPLQPNIPISQELVTFAVSQNGNLLKTFPVRTDINGRAALPPTGLSVGTYNVTASFAGSELYHASTLAIGSLQVTTPCPLGQKTKVRWHYSANGSPGNWASDKDTSCADGSVAFATQATEGTLNLAPGTTINYGFALQLPGNKTHFNALVMNGKAVFPVGCVSGATPSQSTITLNLAPLTVLLDSKSWNPSSNKSDPSVYQGSGTIPNVCAGGQVRLNQGGSFSAFITLN